MRNESDNACILQSAAAACVEVAKRGLAPEGWGCRDTAGRDPTTHAPNNMHAVHDGALCLQCKVHVQHLHEEI